MSTTRTGLGLRLAKPDAKHDRWGPLYLLGNLGAHVLHPKEGAQRSRVRKLLKGMRYALPVEAFASCDEGHADLGGILDAEGAARVKGAVYDDLFVGHPMRALVVTTLLTKDERAVFEMGSKPDYAWIAGLPGGVAEWAMDYRKDLDPFPIREEAGFALDMIVRGQMGTGYTSGTRPSDGSPDIGEVVVPLEDGSALHGWAMLWFNK